MRNNYFLLLSHNDIGSQNSCYTVCPSKAVNRRRNNEYIFVSCAIVTGAANAAFAESENANETDASATAPVDDDSHLSAIELIAKRRKLLEEYRRKIATAGHQLMMEPQAQASNIIFMRDRSYSTLQVDIAQLTILNFVVLDW